MRARVGPFKAQCELPRRELWTHTVSLKFHSRQQT